MAWLRAHPPDDARCGSPISLNRVRIAEMYSRHEVTGVHEPVCAQARPHTCVHAGTRAQTCGYVCMYVYIYIYIL